MQEQYFISLFIALVFCYILASIASKRPGKSTQRNLDRMWLNRTGYVINKSYGRNDSGIYSEWFDPNERPPSDDGIEDEESLLSGLN